MASTSLQHWLTASQQLLLRAILADGEQAIAAWRQWQAQTNLETLDSGSFFLLSQLYLKLSQLQVNDPSLAKLRGIYRHTWLRNQIAMRSTAMLLELFAKANIPALIMKGVPLVLLHYRDLGARMMMDVDVLIHQQDLHTAATLLQDSGWKMDRPLPPASLAPIVRAMHFRQPGLSELDLHWRPFTADCPHTVEEQLWQCAVAGKIQGVAAQLPDPTDLLLSTCFHARRADPHSTCRWICDAMVLLKARQPSIDWQALLERAQQAGLLLPVRDCLTYLKQEFGEFGAEIPEDFLHHLQNFQTSPEEQRRYFELVRENRMHRGLLEKLGCHWWRYCNTKSVVDGPGRLFGFIPYYLTFKQWEWQLAHPWQVPGKVLSKEIKRLTGRV